MTNHKSLLERFNSAAEEEKVPFLLSINRHWLRKLLEQLSDRDIAETLAYSDEDDALACLATLPAKRRKAILSLLRAEKSDKLRRLLAFAPDTAGRLVDSNFIEVKQETEKVKIIQKVKSHHHKTGKKPTIIVESSGGKIVGQLPFERLIIDDWKAPADLRLRKLPTVSSKLDQEKLIERVTGTSTKIIAVVDEKDRTLGIVRTHDLLRVLQEEATEDFYRFAGVPPEEHIFDSPLRAVRLRSRWLILNLFTAILAAAVISLFSDTIEQVVILAAFMPVVAGMGGNAGTQTLAVMVRGIATGEIRARTAHWVVLKEIGAGLLNGLITGAIVGLIALIWQGSVLLGAVLFAAMIVNLFVAGLFGTLIPLALRALRIDPAVASSIFITTATDIIGFIAFLSLATWLLL